MALTGLMVAMAYRQILATGKPAWQQGFTLLELLLVMLLIGVLSTSVLLSTPTSPANTLRAQEKALIRYLRLVRQQAVFSVMEIGLVYHAESLTPVFFSEDKWRQNSEIPVFYRHKDLDWVLQLEGEQVTPQTGFIEGESAPQIVFFSDGLYSMFRFSLAIENGEKIILEGLHTVDLDE